MPSGVQPMATSSSRMPGQPLGHTARGGHHEHVGVAVIISRERDLASRRVRRPDRLHARARGEPAGVAAFARDAPEVAGVGEDNMRPAQGGLAKEIIRRCHGKTEYKQEGKQRTSTYSYSINYGTCSHIGRTAQNGRLLARRQLSVGRPDLPLRQSAAHGAAHARAHQAAAARPLGHHAGAELHLCPLQPPDQEIRPEHDLRRRPRSRRAGHGGQHVSGRHLQRDLSRTSRRTPRE